MAVDISIPLAKGLITPEFEIDSERVIVPTFSGENVKPSGLRLSRTENLGQFYDVTGHRSLLMGYEGEDFEVWIYPFKAFQNCEIGFLVNQSIIWGDTIRKSFTTTPEEAVIVYETPGLKVTQTIFAPINEPGLIMLFKVSCKKPVAIIAKLKDDLRLMWAADNTELYSERGCDKGTGAWVIRSKGQNIAVMAGWAGGGSHMRLPDDPRLEGSIAVVKEVHPDVLSSLVIAGSTNGIDYARKTWVKLAKNPFELMDATAHYYHSVDSETLSISLPDKCIGEAFRWAKIGLNKCYKTTPGLGSGFVAGFNRSDNSSRPGFGWYFGRDSSWTGFSFNILGEFEKTRKNLELLTKYQIKEGSSKGKIYHEISSAHDFIPEADCDYAYPAGDSTPFYVVDMADYLRWSGDLNFIKDNWQHIVNAMDWCFHMDMNDLTTIWCRALESAAYMAKSVDDERSAEWENEVEKVRAMLDTLSTANTTIPLLWNQIDPDKADKAIDKMIQHEGYHEGMVRPLVTGWTALACFNNHRIPEGLSYLKANTDLTRDFCLGYLTEVLDYETQSPIGCPHQASSEAMVIQPVVEGLLGIHPDALQKTVIFAPHLPDDWGTVKVKHLKIASSTFDISYERKEQKTRITVKQTDGDEGFSIIINPAFLKSTTSVSAWIDGEPTKPVIQRTPGDVHACVKVPLEHKLVVDFEEN